MGLPTGDDYVDELVRSLARGEGLSKSKDDTYRRGDDAVGERVRFDFDAFARRERRREREYHAAWDAICRHADFANPISSISSTSEGVEETEASTLITHTSSKANATTRRLAASDTLAAVRALGIASANAEDANAMISLLERRNDRCASTAWKERTQEHTVGYAEFKKYAALLPSAQLRDNAAWNWLAAATGPERSAEQTPPRAQPAKQLFAGGLAGVAARTAVAPLDRARTIMQDLHPRASSADGAAMKNGLAKAAKPIKPRARGLTGTCLKVLREEGVVGLWRGNAVTALKVVPCNALQFAIFHQMKDAFRRRRERREREARKNGDVASSSSSSSSSGLTLPERLASGSVAGAISTAVCYPLDTLKSQMAVRGGLKGSALRAARQMFAEQGGARAFYKGLGPTLVADIVGTGLGFTLYDSFNSWYQKNVTGGRKPSPAEKGVLGGLSACVCLTATQPLEVVMTRMRVQGVGGRPVLYKNMLDCLAVTARREGWRSLWLGTGAAYAKIFPQLAITYYVFEMASEQMGVGGLARYDAGKRTGKIVTP
jgi:solute carrier family 25 (mitochondrial phosphate transporter), member 23/24/25/41